MQERRKIALTSLLDNKICGYASCVLDLENYIRPNVALLAAHRRGDHFAKKRLKGIVCGTPLENCSLRNDQNFAPWGRGALRFLDFDKMPFATTPIQFVNSFFAKFAHIDGFEDCCVGEVSASGGCHIFAPALSDDAKADMKFYQQFADSPVDLSCGNSSRVALLSGELICLTSYRPLFTRVDDRIVDELIAMRDAMEGTQPESLVQEAVKIPCAPVSSVVKKESCDLEVYAELLNDLLRQNGGTPQKGERNTTMFKCAVDLISIGCDQLEDLVTLFRDHRFFGLSEREARQSLASALKREEPTRSDAMRQAQTTMLDELPVAFALSNEISVHGKSEHTDTPPEPVCDATTESESASEGAVDAFGDFSPWQKHAPAMPSKLPPFVRTLLKPIKRKSLWPHCLGMSEPTLATLLQGTTFTDLVGDTHSLYCGWMACGIAASSSGKSSAWKPIDAICRASGLYEEDALARQELDDWRKSERKRSTASAGSDRPRNTSRILGSSSTQAAIVQRHADLEGGRSLLMNCSEISALDDAAGGAGKKFWLMNFDNDWFRQERSSSASDSFAVRLSMNISTCCPPSVAQDWFRGEWLTGQITRWNLTTIIADPDEDDSDELYGNLTGYEDTLKVYLSRLDEVAGKHLEVRAIRDLVKRLRDEMLDYAAATGSTALKVLVRRASLRFQKCALLYYTLEGSRMSPLLTEFLVWRWRCMIFSTFFTLGDLIEREQAKDDAAISGRQKQNGPVNLLSFLPEEFDMAKLRALRVERKFADNSDTALKNQVRTWRNRKLISEVSPGVWRKCKK